jgi:hypothetical protein
VERADAYTVAELLLARPSAVALARLRTLAAPDGSWSTALTPFHGAGQASLLETTALATLALDRAGDPSDRARLDSALLTLLGSSSADGAWATTRATVEVLSALAEMLPRGRAGSVEVTIGGKVTHRLDLSEARERQVDVTGELAAAGTRIVELRSTEGGVVSAQLVTSWAEPWTTPAPGPLGLRVDCAPLQARVGDEVTCDLRAQRAAGTGMLLLRAGLPPGAEIDRSSLARAGASRVEVEPDSVVFYIWPPQGAEWRGRFSFRPRLEVDAQAAPSSLVDFYNPDLSVELQPCRYSIGPR